VEDAVIATQARSIFRIVETIYPRRYRSATDGNGQGGSRALGPDGFFDDNFIPMYADAGCVLHDACLTCPLTSCLQDVKSEPSGMNHRWSVNTALERHVEAGGIVTACMASHYTGKQDIVTTYEEELECAAA
jgi:hypothetical protein